MIFAGASKGCPVAAVGHLATGVPGQAVEASTMTTLSGRPFVDEYLPSQAGRKISSAYLPRR